MEDRVTVTTDRELIVRQNVKPTRQGSSLPERFSWIGRVSWNDGQTSSPFVKAGPRTFASKR